MTEKTGPTKGEPPRYLVEAGGKTFSFTLVRSKRRTLSLQIKDGRLIARAPLRIAFKTITDFITEKASWIDRNINRQNKDKGAAQTAGHLGNGSILPFLGGELSVSVGPGTHIKPGIRGEKLFLPEMPPSDIPTAAMKILRLFAEPFLKERLAEESERTGLPVTGFALSNAKHIWGTCTAKRLVRLNWRLVFMPPEIIRYVICHELAHTRHMDHSSDFWAFVGQLCPDYKGCETRLKREGRAVLGLFR